MDNAGLINRAVEAREFAAPALSGFKVGAALLTADGRVFTGCNIEDPSGIGVTNICAERCAMVKAISEGCRDFVRIAVAGGPGAGGVAGAGGVGGVGTGGELVTCLPCGACRQYMNSFNPGMVVVYMDGDEIKELTLRELLPHSFSEVF